MPKVHGLERLPDKVLTVWLVPLTKICFPHLGNGNEGLKILAQCQRSPVRHLWEESLKRRE